MRKLFSLTLLFLFAGSVAATETTIKTYSSFRDFRKGESRGVAISHDGVLRPAPRVGTVAMTELEQIWRVARSGRATWLAGGSPATLLRVEDNGSQQVVFTSDSAHIFALTAAGGDVYFAPSPGGVIYRVRNGAAEQIAELDAGYVWDLYWDGTALFAATGTPGAVWRITAQGSPSLWFESEELHIRSLAPDGKGGFYAGSADNGLIFHIDARGKGFVFYDTRQTEIFAVVPDGDGGVWAAGASERIALPAPGSGSVSVTALVVEGKEEQGGGSAPSGSARGSGRKGALYHISSRGVAENFWGRSYEQLQSLARRPDGTLLAGTGDKGLLYAISPEGDISLLLDTEASQITHILVDGRAVYLATANQGGALRVDAGPVKSGSYLSPVLDTDVRSRWGSLSWQGQGKVVFSVRSGNSSEPDNTWSEWQRLDGVAQGSPISAPPARFLQWRVVLQRGASVDEVSLGYRQDNVPPRIRSITVHNPGDAWLEAVANGKRKKKGDDDSGSTRKGKKTRKQGFQSISWDADDANEDALQFTLYYRGGGVQVWREMVSEYSGSVYSWDTRTMEDGSYRIRIVASDVRSNTPATALSAEKVSAEIVVDNTGPEIRALRYRAGTVSFTARDAASRIGAAWYAVDTEEWQKLLPEDGIADTREESFTIDTKELKKGPHTMTIKIHDERSNISIRHINFEVK